MTRAELARQFRDFERSCETSPLYARLSRAVADDDALLALAAQVQPGQPPHTQLRLTAWRGGTPTEETLADADPHGAWLEWRQD